MVDTVRIDSRLTQKYPYSRAFFQHILERGGVQVNGKVVKKSYKVSSEDHVEIDNLERFLSPVVLDEAPNIDLPIVWEKEDYLIINKPKGVLSHPNSVRDVNQPSVVGFLYHRYKDLPSYGNFIRAGLIHRLDKETDGLMIVAKTEKWLAHFKQLFSEKSESETLEEKMQVKLQKFYRAVCEVSPAWEEFLQEIKKSWLPFVMDEIVYPKVPNPNPKRWITVIENVQTLDTKRIEVTLQLLTGRTHQIRYHLSHHGLPIVGDYLYGQEAPEGMQLTAWKLIFQDIYGEMRELEI